MQRLPFTTVELEVLCRQMRLTAKSPLFLPPACLSTVAPVLTVYHITDFLVMWKRSARSAPLRR